jgi:hypothetical protein
MVPFKRAGEWETMGRDCAVRRDYVTGAIVATVTGVGRTVPLGSPVFTTAEDPRPCPGSTVEADQALIDSGYSLLNGGRWINRATMAADPAFAARNGFAADDRGELLAEVLILVSTANTGILRALVGDARRYMGLP